MYTTKPFLFSSVVIGSLVSSVAMADQLPKNLMTTIDSKAMAVYWTPERMRHAAAMELPKASLTRKLSMEELKELYKGVSPEVIKKASFPTVDIAPQKHQLFEPIEQKSLVLPQDTGISNEQFSSSQLTPLTANQSYPYTTVGKLFFTTPSGNKTCSAAVVAKRLVLTAGHCVHSGNGSASGYYSGWTFVPAFNNGNAPFQTWTARIATISQEWYVSGGTVPNSGDWALLVMADQNVGGTTQSIGNVVGTLGIQTLSTIPNHAHLLGYPGNLDNGQLMHQVTAQSAVAVSPNNAEYGSDMNLGSGGGPWIQNFGAASVGQTGGNNSARNMLIGLASYGYNDTVTLAEGSSILNSSFTSYFNSICNLGTGNC